MSRNDSRLTWTLIFPRWFLPLHLGNIPQLTDKGVGGGAKVEVFVTFLEGGFTVLCTLVVTVLLSHSECVLLLQLLVLLLLVVVVVVVVVVVRLLLVL